MNIGVIERIARWIGSMLRMFGLGEGETSEIGWGQEVQEGQEGVNVSRRRFHLWTSGAVG